MNSQQKAAKTRAERAANRVWEDVKRRKSLDGCTCALRKGMTYEDLAKLGGGCTDAPERGFANNGEGRWVCPTLDAYRRLVGMPVMEAA